MPDFLMLLETGDFLLLETGDKLIIGSSVIPTDDTTISFDGFVSSDKVSLGSGS